MKNPKKKKVNKVYIVLLVILSLALVSYVLYKESQPNPIKTTKQKVFLALKKGEVEKMMYQRGHLYITLKKNVYYQQIAKQKREGKEVLKENQPNGPHLYLYTSLREFNKDYKLFLQKQNIEKEVFVDQEESSGILEYFLPSNGISLLFLILLLFMILSFFFEGVGGSGGILNIGRSKATLWGKKRKTGVTFDDVQGMEDSKLELQEMVDFFKEPEKYIKIGARPPKGALLVGPPGTGKTLLAKALAGEAGVPFLTISGSDFIEMFVGVGAKRVRDLFQQARKNSPCIIFIDEIDAIGKKRSRSLRGSNQEGDNTLNQLLTEMDGFLVKDQILIIGSTNRGEILDSALTRSGRFDRKIMTSNPTLKERIATFRYYLKKIKVDKKVNPTRLAEQTVGFTYADIANAVNEAALTGARNSHTKVTEADFVDGIDRLIAGSKKAKLPNKKDLHTVAYHEAGHAIVSWALEHANPLVKVTIIPRSQGSLGHAQYLPKETYLTRKEGILAERCVLLGGRIAEELTCGDISSGAQNDLEVLFKMMHRYVTIFGMSKEIGHVSYYDSSDPDGHRFVKPYSEGTALRIDQKIDKLTREGYQIATDILTKYKKKLEEVAQALLKKETLLASDFMKIMGPHPYKKDLKEPTQEENKPQKTTITEPIIIE